MPDRIWPAIGIIRDVSNEKAIARRDGLRRWNNLDIQIHHFLEFAGTRQDTAGRAAQGIGPGFGTSGLQRSYSNGLLFSVHYTWSKASELWAAKLR